MARFFSSDLHLGHKNIIKFCDRPFADPQEMNQRLIDQINSVVLPDDELWMLGDVAMGSLMDSLAVFERIQARVILVAGNHDRCHPANGKKHLDKIDLYRNLKNVRELHLESVDLELSNGQRVLVNHFPYVGDSGSEDRHVEFRPIDNGAWLLCGHVHDSWRQDGRQINVGIDAWGGQIVPESSIIDLINSGPSSLPSIPW